MKIIVIILFCVFTKIGFSNENSVIVLMYHRFDQNHYPSTNISSSLFRKHLEIIQSENFNVIGIDHLVKILREGKELPDKTVLITVDDAFKSFFNNAYPILKEFGFPFSIFVSTASISSKKNSDYMSWEMLKELSLNGGLILNHTVNHDSLLELNDGEIISQVLSASKEINLKIGNQPNILSYPYGESSIRVEKIIEDLGIEAAFSQHSSPLSNYDFIYRLPRFALNDEYGKIKRFKMILNTERLPIDTVSFKDTIINQDKLSLEFKSDFDVQNINCFINEGAILNKQISDKSFFLELSNLKVNTRHRLNCTLIQNNNVLWYGKIIKRIN